MSKRHRDQQVQGLPVDERRRDIRRLRHETRVLLAAADPDDVALPTPVKKRPHGRPSSSTGRRFRHWKAAFWKRRTAMRHQRNVELAMLAGD